MTRSQELLIRALVGKDFSPVIPSSDEWPEGEPMAVTSDPRVKWDSRK
jgi:hypothetical protein